MYGVFLPFSHFLLQNDMEMWKKTKKSVCMRHLKAGQNIQHTLACAIIHHLMLQWQQNRVGLFQAAANQIKS